MKSPEPSKSLRRAVFVAVAAVVAWRVAVLLLPQAEPRETSLVIQALLAVVGLTFLACGLLVILKAPVETSPLFAGFCICSGLHWGGPLELSPAALRTGLLLFYLLVSGILGATLLLHLALRFPTPSRLANRVVVGLSYLPVGLAAVLAATLLVGGPESGLRTVTREWFLLLHTIVSNLFSVLALALVAGRLVGIDSKKAHRPYVGLMVAGMLVAWLPYTIASAAGVEDTDVWNLTVAALPVSFTIAFFAIYSSADSKPRDGEGNPVSKLLVPALLLALLSASQTSAAVAPTTPADAERVLPSEMCRGLIIVPVTFGEGDGTTLALILDTGSSWTFVDPAALSRIAGGRARKVSFQSSRIGRHELGPLRAQALPMRDLSLALGRDVDGILGFPVFRDVLLTLDYPAGEVRVASGRLPRPDGREIFPAPGARPHIELAIGDRRIKVQVDSGSSGRFQLKASDRLTWSVKPRPATSSVGVGGLVVQKGGRLDVAVGVGPLDFEDPVVILGGRERQIGWHVLRHFVLTFDQKNRRMRMLASHTGPVRMAPLVGTGLAYDSRPDGLRVVRVFPGTAAEASGLREGDLIVAIDGVPVPARECDDTRSKPAGQRQLFSYVRDGIRAETRVETEALVP